MEAAHQRTSVAATDGSGTIYVADSGRHVIRKVTANGAITTFARGVDQPGSADGTAKVARFRDPAHLTVDADRNFYVVDPGESYDPEDQPPGCSHHDCRPRGRRGCE